MKAGSKRPTDVESPMWATVVQLVVVGVGCTTVVLVVLVVLEGGSVEVVVATGTVVVGTATRVVVAAAVAVAGVASSGDAAVAADSTSSPSASGPLLQLTVDVAATTASATTRRGRATLLSVTRKWPSMPETFGITAGHVTSVGSVSRSFRLKRAST
jgi:hypothetical protein